MIIINNIEEIKQICAQAINMRVFSGVGLGVASGKKAGGQQQLLTLGTTRYEGGEAVGEETLFDLASLTKPLATTLLLLTMVKEGAVRLEQRLDAFFDQVPPDKGAITIRDLLGHSSGFAAHHPYYQTLTTEPLAQREESLRRQILSEPLHYATGTKAVYSDLGFLLLGFVVEKVAGMGLDSLFSARIAEPLGLGQTLFFNRLGAQRRGGYATTEECPWRGRVLAGEVSDENCFTLGGVAGHAGLFGTTGAVLTLVTAIHDLWQGKEGPLAIVPTDVQQALRRQPIPGSTWALGFDTPSAAGSTSGAFFSPRSAGHLGFTGTSFWIDPEQHVMVVLLTNRVHPSRENNAIRVFRPLLHDAVMRGLGLAAS